MWVSSLFEAFDKVETTLKEIKVAFLSPSKSSENLNFSTVHSRKNKILGIFAG